MKLFRDIAKLRTEMLFELIRKLSSILWISGMLAGITLMLIIFWLSKKDLNNQDLYVLIFSLFFFSALNGIVWWYLNRKVLPELKKRIKELPLETSGNKRTIEEYIEKFRKRKKRAMPILILGLIYYFSIFILLRRAGIIDKPGKDLFGTLIAVILFVPVLLAYVYNWRCPACGAFLGRESNPKSCLNCGVTLNEK